MEPTAQCAQPLASAKVASLVYVAITLWPWYLALHHSSSVAVVRDTIPSPPQTFALCVQQTPFAQVA
jgi:hypothetical protein